MKFKIGKASIESALRKVSGAVGKSDSAVLACVMVEADGGDVHFETTDLDTSIRCSCKAESVIEPGRWLIPHARLSQVCKSISGYVIDVTVEGSVARLKSGKAEFSLPALASTDWPGFAEVDGEYSIKMGASMLAMMFSTVKHAMMRDSKDNSPMRGIRIESDGSKASFIATDKYRIAMADLPGDYGSMNVVIPPVIVNASGEFSGHASIVQGDGKVSVVSDSMAITSRCLEGNYPKASVVMGNKRGSGASFATEDIKSAVGRAKVVDRNMSFNVDGLMATVKAKGNDGESMREDVACDSPVGIDVTLNAQFLHDALSQCSESVTITNDAPNKPVFVECEGFAEAIMPVNPKAAK